LQAHLLCNIHVLNVEFLMLNSEISAAPEAR